jgi:hypothetical protein
MTPETATKKKIVAYLDTVPGLWHVAFHNTGYTRKGIPDRLCVYRGRFVALEIKAPGGVASPWQRREIAAIVEAGGIAEVVWTVEQVMAIVERVDG